MKLQYCLPIIKSTIKEVLQTIEKNRKEYDVFEIWVDYLQDDQTIILDEVKNLVKQLNDKLLLVFRKQNHETISMPFDERKKILQICANTNVLVDLDIDDQQEDIAFIQDHKLILNIVCSYHNYKKTPELKELEKIIEQMKIIQPRIFKIATMCVTEQDPIILLELLLELKKQKLDTVILGMGEMGKITRIFGPLLGNVITFAPATKEEESAPGQLTKQQLENIFAIVERD